MLDFNHILSTPGADIQLFNAAGSQPSSVIPSVVIVNTTGLLTVTAGIYYIGQAITITGTFSAGSITGYVSGTTYYIISVVSSTSILISASPGGGAVTSTTGTATPGATFTLITLQWQTWRKPRGCKFIYMLAVGGGASGGCGTNTATTSGGGGGGGSGAQSMLMIPAMLVPDILYIQCGQGGRQPATLVSGAAGVAGIASQVCIESFIGPQVVPNNTFLLANGGAGGTAATTTAAGGAGTGGTVATISDMCLAGRGIYTLLAGQAGSAGGNGTAGTAGSSVTVPTTGLMVTGGGGGGGKTATVFGAGSVITMPTGGVSTGSSDFFPSTGTTPAAASGATPAGIGRDGISVRNMIMNLGGGGGGSASATSGGIAGAGGNGAPGCGGGGAGGSSSTAGLTTLARPGDGGDGFVYIISI